MGSLAISPCNAALRVGQTLPMVALFGGTTLLWESSNPRVATVDANGIVTAVAQSSERVTITVMDEVNGRRVSAEVCVGALTVTRGNAPVTQIELDAGDTADLSVSQSVGRVTWDSSAPNVVTVDPSTGHVTALNLGAVILRAMDQATPPNVGYVSVRSGTLLVYGADGRLYMVPPDAWTRATLVPSQEAGVPTKQQMDAIPQQSTQEMMVYVPPTVQWTTCYVLNPATVTPPEQERGTADVRRART